MHRLCMVYFFTKFFKMIKIKQTYTDFIKELHIGVRAFFVELDPYGYEEKEDILATNASAFSYVVFFSKNNDILKYDISTVCKNIQKLNPFTHIMLHVDGFKRPIGFNTLKNVEYIVHVPRPTNTIKDEEYDDDVDCNITSVMNENAWKWLAKADAKFIFEVHSVEDFDDISIVTSGLMIKKHQIYCNIMSCEDYKEKVLYVKQYGFNVFVQLGGDWCE